MPAFVSPLAISSKHLLFSWREVLESTGSAATGERRREGEVFENESRLGGVPVEQAVLVS